jgi:hypothetical protein
MRENHDDHHHHHLYPLRRADSAGNSVAAYPFRRRRRRRPWDVRLLLLTAVLVLFDLSMMTTTTTTTTTKIVEHPTKKISFFFLPLALALTASNSKNNKNIQYGADVSFPMHQDHVTTNYDWLPHNTLPQLYKSPEGYVAMPIQPLGNRQEIYSEYIRGCIEFYEIHGRRCLDTERERINMNKRQPQSMVNYTHEVGIVYMPGGDFALIECGVRHLTICVS